MKMRENLEWTGERLTRSKQNEIMIHHLHRYALALSFVKDKTVLDIASGEGYGSNLMSTVASYVFGVDISTEAIEYAQSRYRKSNLTFKVGSADSIPCDENSIDVIISFETIEHHDRHCEMLKEFKRILRPGGIVLISSPDKLHYTDNTGFNNPFHVKELYAPEFKSLLQDFFTNVEMYNQNILYGSLIVPDQNSSSTKFGEFKGDFDTISTCNTLSIPMYNIIIASDSIISEQFPSCSFFNAEDLLRAIENKEMEIYNSKTYRLGRIISAPYRILSGLLNRK